MRTGARNQRGVTRRDLPAVFLALATFFAIFAVLFPLAGRLDLASRNELKPVTGTVASRPRWHTGKGAGIYIPIQTADGLHTLAITDFHNYDELMALKPGDAVTALVRPLGAYGVWELKHDGITLVSYEEMREGAEREERQARRVGSWLGLMSFVCAIAAVSLRRHYGSWRGSNPSPEAVIAHSERA